ncbi:hypothetical protein CRG98_038805 [Punica granatum]|uniref:RING-type domain-containing protein n=1 Tax=Punica granatum TaxID=22663 RepID=A0A2I0I9W3_PUNGR|nr:hypothetical protein CRG98_038805 [Punica granatum]
MDRDSSSGRSWSLTSTSGVRVKQERISPSPEREDDVASGTDSSFTPQAPVSPFAFGHTPGMSRSQNVVFSSDPNNMVHPVTGEPIQDLSVFGPQHYARSSLYYPQQNPVGAIAAPDSNNDAFEDFIGQNVLDFLNQISSDNSPVASPSENVLDAGAIANQATDASYELSLTDETRSRAGLGSSYSYSQQLQPLEESDGPYLALGIRGGSELSSGPSASSSRYPHAISASFPHQANAALSHGREGPVNFLQPDPNASGGFHAPTDHVAGVSPSIYDQMIFDPEPLQAVQDMRQTLFGTWWTQNANNRHGYHMANSGAFNGGPSRTLPFPSQGRAAQPLPSINRNQGELQGFRQYAQKQSPLHSSSNFHGAAQTAFHGMQSSHAQIGRNFLPRGPMTIAPPGLPGTPAMSRQNQPGQVRAAASSLQHPQCSQLGCQFHKRTALGHALVNPGITHRRTTPPPSLPVQGEASRPALPQVGLYLPQLGQAAQASSIPAQIPGPIHWGLRPVQPRARASRPMSARARSYVPLSQSSVQKIPSLQRRGRQRGSSSLSIDPNAHIPPSALSPPSTPIDRIRCEGEKHQLTGEKCFFCHRDLSYPPEGPIVENPAILPRTAVLPCGHAFHEFCLFRITPPEQMENPPCIPCAVGEEP